MYMCSYMKWIAFVQKMYRTLAVYQEQNEFSKKNLLVLIMTMVIWNGLQCGVSLPSKARIHSGRSERLEADGQPEEQQRKREKKGKRTPPFLLSLLALEAVIVVMVIKLQTSMKVYIAVIAI